MSEMNEGGSFFSGDGFWGIIVLFFIFAMFGGGLGGFGNNAATQGALTRAELADGFNTASLQRNQNDLMRDQFNLQQEIMNNRFAQQECCCTTQQNILQNRYDNAMGQAGIQREILDNRYNTLLGFNNMQARQDACCSDLKTAIHAEGEATRALINANTMQELRDNLQAAQLQLGNLSQTQTLLAAIDKVPQPAYITCSPYQTAYNPYAQNACGGCCR